MQNEYKTTSTSRRLLFRIGLGLIAVFAVGSGIWFSISRTPTEKGKFHVPMGNMAAVPVTSPDPSDSTKDSSDLQVDLGPDDLKKAQVQTVHVDIQVIANTLRVPGNVEPDQYKEVHVTPLVGGIVRQVSVVLGDRVKRGQTLAVVFSSELAEAESGYLAVLAELEAEHKKLQRTENLVRLGAASRQEEEDVTATHAAHEAHVRSAQEKLRLLGANDRQIAELTQAAQINANLSVPAPINGVVLTRTANLGLVTNVSQELFTVADLSTVWVMASINEKDFSQIHVGTRATVTTPAYPGRAWKGRVVYIEPQVDRASRTAQARIEVSNPDESLRLDMYVDVAFASEGVKGLAVPESAVQAIGDKQYVFLPVEDSEGSFSVRQVKLGPASNDFFAVLEGLKPNDIVVTQGSFILKAEAVRQHPEL